MKKKIGSCSENGKDFFQSDDKTFISYIKFVNFFPISEIIFSKNDNKIFFPQLNFILSLESCLCIPGKQQSRTEIGQHYLARLLSIFKLFIHCSPFLCFLYIYCLVFNMVFITQVCKQMQISHFYHHINLVYVYQKKQKFLTKIIANTTTLSL